ncbi:hypothetical protein EDE04_6897 [Streptomyces sp. 2132.2]|uniref:hypothetical protein n=1 Tax=Streptomyces sp. 2132.2 TaxID=2485161 RepID=UPI000F463443|nr:hypothetical protein [Streptomyces sp. 2132.2]ROR00334.1 hypothetical protein EDE04_6897 [Streptomyces sp. 2132.2]
MVEALALGAEGIGGRLREGAEYFHAVRPQVVGRAVVGVLVSGVALLPFDPQQVEEGRWA